MGSPAVYNSDAHAGECLKFSFTAASCLKILHSLLAFNYYCLSFLSNSDSLYTISAHATSWAIRRRFRSDTTSLFGF